MPRRGPLEEWLTTFHLATVVLDPYTNESSWILPTATRILEGLRGSDARVNFLVTADADDAKAFLGPLIEQFLVFTDPDRAGRQGARPRPSSRRSCSSASTAPCRRRPRAGARRRGGPSPRPSPRPRPGGRRTSRSSATPARSTARRRSAEPADGRRAEAALPDLPIVEILDDLRAALAGPGRAVVAAPPGAGKTTVVPLALLDEPWLGDRRIVVLEPRRLATRAAARRMAELTATSVGGLVGYQTRDERHIGAATRIEVVTEGVLTRRLQQDPELPGVGLVVFDEVHERNLTTDLGLALTLDAAATLRPDLRIVAMSATADTALFARLLATADGPAPIVESAGRIHPVDVRWLPRGRDERLEPAVVVGGPAGARRGGRRRARVPARASVRSPASPTRCAAPSAPTSTSAVWPARWRSRSRTGPWRRRRPDVAGSCWRPTSPRRR